MESCNNCKGPKRDPRYRACAKCREGWRLDKGLSYQKKTVPVESYQKAIKAAHADGFKAGQEAMCERAAAFYENHAPRLKGKGEDGYKMVHRDLVLLPSEQATADAIRNLPIEQPESSPEQVT